jgi:hypothetical protein
VTSGPQDHGCSAITSDDRNRRSQCLSTINMRRSAIRKKIEEIIQWL